MTIKDKWDSIYRSSQTKSEVASVLLNNDCLLPKQGAALDLACGTGANALFLAGKGLTVHAWDISSVALDKLGQQAQEKNLSIQLKNCHITADVLPENSFNVIVVSRFLDRTLCPAIMAALKKQGLLFYQTFNINKLSSQGPTNPDYLLQKNELLDLFRPLSVVYYQEYAQIGDMHYGNRDESLYIGQKTT